MRGIVSSLSHQASSAEHGEGMLAAGTWTRWIGLYDMGGLGGMVSTWSIADAADKDAKIGGTGITQTLWSACGRYLYVVERKSRGVLVYDVRVTGKLVGWLEGRNADTNQRLGVDVFEGEGGMEIWAGGTDGVVKTWQRVGATEGAVQTSWEWRAHDGGYKRILFLKDADYFVDPVSSTIVHSSGTVVATCSGQRSIPDFGDSEDDGSSDEGSSSSGENETPTYSLNATSRTPDNTIKVWSF